MNVPARVRTWAAAAWLSAALLVCLCTGTAGAQIQAVGDGDPGPVKAQHLTAELVSLGPAIAPGGQQVVGLALTMEEHWHVYWINAGDSGEPPKIDWTLPPGYTAGTMQFPIPERLPLGPLMDYGYEDEVAFPVTISAPANAQAGPAHLDAQVSWLVCSQVCIPGKAHLGIDLQVQAGAPQPAQEAKIGLLGKALNSLPKPLPGSDKFSVVADGQNFALTFLDGKKEEDAEFYPLDKDPTDLIVNAADQNTEPRRDGVRLVVKRSPELSQLPSTLHGVLKLSDTEAYEVNAPITKGNASAASPRSAILSGSTPIGAIGLAFVGGIILNLMPCVFPVLFLKGLALVQTANAEGKAESHALQHGLTYTLGILVSFWAIVAVLLGLRATGGHAGWGFQLQSPVFVAVLASLMFLLALSLAGMFEIGLSLTSVGGSLAQKQGFAGSFFTGVLATVVATPCTAPFMGAAIGFALAQSAGVTFAVFTALAVGLAAPYLLLSWQPAWAKLLPKPGAWMEVLKQITSIPLFATAIWLAWVYGQLFPAGQGVNQIALLLLCFLLLAVAGWVLGRWPAKVPGLVAAVAVIALAIDIPVSQRKHAHEVSAATRASATVAQSDSGPLTWQPYSEQAVDAARTGGHPVFIDFTASWCLSCQFNEKTVLDSAEVQSALKNRNFTLIKADWTNDDPDITKKLASVGRAGVPTYVIYPAASSAAADVLPELLSKDLVLRAIERDTK